ncbi:MAG: hypothetical protein NC206_06775 [Bacteroides sp.]|nr:hypothetical protein [Roseburia sp.]MCM1346774.1 hypothetical protein [Bacteroides sp.]MCM1420660.1 hypothetical protein [Bacteroides sp.]
MENKNDRINGWWQSLFRFPCFSMFPVQSFPEICFSKITFSVWGNISTTLPLSITSNHIAGQQYADK